MATTYRVPRSCASWLSISAHAARAGATPVDPDNSGYESILVAWTAPGPGGHATVRLPGSKSMMARALVLGAISDGVTTLQPLRARDSELMANGLRALGTAVHPRR